MDIPSLMYRRLRGDAIETYKYLHGIYQIDCSFLLLNQSNTGVINRGHYLKLTEKDCKTAELTFWVIVLWTFGILCLNMWWQPTQLTVSKDALTSFVLICDSALTSSLVDDFWFKLRSVNRPSVYTRLLIWWWLITVSICRCRCHYNGETQHKVGWRCWPWRSKGSSEGSCNTSYQVSSFIHWYALWYVQLNCVN